MDNQPTPMNSKKESEIIQIDDSKIVRPYPGDLTKIEKLILETNFIDDQTLKIQFKSSQEFNVTIREQDMFKSHAKVIVNAANTHLGGGGGIDGAIHSKGGNKYKSGHSALQTLYSSNYVLGHAAMIGSGSMRVKDEETDKEKIACSIDHVIVVAGPQGSTSLEKENALYSCYYNSLLLAHSQNITSIAFPSISTGVFGFPKDRAAAISLKAIYDFINRYPETTVKIISIHFVKKTPEELKINNDPQEFLINYQKAAGN